MSQAWCDLLKTDSILISGAGVAGIVCGLRLARAGFRPVIVEKAREPRVGGFLVSISHHAHRYMRDMGFLPELETRSCGIAHSSYHDRSRMLLELSSKKLFSSVDVIQMMRDELVDVLYGAAKNEIEFRFETEICSIEQHDDGAQVSFSDGQDEQYAVVVGSDGLHSGVRRLGFPSDATKLHFLDLMCAAFRAPNVRGFQGRFETHMRRNRYMATFSTGADDVGNVFVWASDQRNNVARENRLSELKRAFSGSGEPIETMIAACPDEGIYMDVLHQVELSKWTHGALVLTGDAAHCMTLFSGRGAGAALNGGARLADALIEHDRDTAFAQYEAQMRPTIDSIQPATRGAVRWYVPRSALNEALRNNAMRWLPNAVFERYFHYKYTNI